MEKRKIRLKEFEDGIQKFTLRLEKLEKRSRKYSFYRLTIFLTALTLFLISFFFLEQTFVWLTLIVFLIVFGFITSVHNKIDTGIKKCRLWLQIKRENIARINIDWNNIPKKKFNQLKSNHPFETDLNITGENSLHQLIDISASDEGSKILKDWLVAVVPDEKIILERQSIIKEIIPLQRFRNKLILYANLTTQKRLKGTKLSSWLQSDSNIGKIKKILTALWLIIPVNILLLLLFIFGVLPAYWSVGVLIYLSIYWLNSSIISELFEKSLEVETEFGKFSGILEFLEKFNYADNKLLKSYCNIFSDIRYSPSLYLKRLNRITTAVSLQKNPLTMLLLNSIFPYDFFFAYKMEKIKKEMKEKLPEWLEKFYNLEALISLSNFAYINPDYVFPSVQKGENDNIFLSEKIAHPFIPHFENVHNDFTISKKGEVIIITGSNMSGKSTFLKSVGVNLALCFAGGVVCASKFQTNLFRLYTCINISDSVTDGISYFYAEVKRLKNLLTEIKTENSIPVFYLIDEIFRGTNNMERLIGSRSYIKAIAGLNGAGLISTHDLELVRLENEIPEVSNYHFKEDVSNGKMIFDYQLRKGPSPTTNALKIMEIEGLPVEK